MAKYPAFPDQEDDDEGCGLIGCLIVLGLSVFVFALAAKLAIALVDWFFG